jgi:hypothetical protein
MSSSSDSSSIGLSGLSRLMGFVDSLGLVTRSWSEGEGDLI